MTEKQIAIQQVESLDSFDPIAYTKGKRTILFAKQNNRLFRIVFSFSKPAFFVLTPTQIEHMTDQDVSDILENYKGDDSDIENRLSYLPTLFKDFKKNAIQPDNQQASFLYEKTCLLISTSENFKTIYTKKEENLKKKKVHPASGSQHSQETKIEDILTLLHSQKKPVKKTFPSEKPSAPTYTTSKLTTSYQELKSKSVLDLITPKPRSQKKEVLPENISPQETSISQSSIDSLERVNNKKEEKSIAYQSEIKNEKGQISHSSSPINSLAEESDALQKDPKELKSTLSSVSSNPVETFQSLTENSLQNKENTNSSISGERGTENTNKISSDLTIQKAKDIHLPLPQGVKEFVLSDDIISFYGMENAMPDFYYFYQINILKSALVHGNKDLKNPLNQSFEFSPHLFNNRILAFKQGPLFYSLSLNPKQPVSFERNVETGERRKLTFDEIKDLITPFIHQEKVSTQETILEIFLNVFESKAFKPSKGHMPTVQQVIEYSHYLSYLSSRQNEDIIPTFCTGSIIMARYNGKYYKAQLGDHPRFETYQNGKMHPMTINEFTLFHKELRFAYDAYTLKERNATALKKSFFDSLREKKDPISTPYLLIQDSTKRLAEQILDLQEHQPPRVKRYIPKVKYGPRVQEAPLAEAAPSQIPLAEEMKEAEIFYEPNKSRPDFKTEQQLNELKKEFLSQNPNSENISLLNPIIGNDNCLYYQKNDTVYVISLDPEQPLFIQTKNRLNTPLKLSKLIQILQEIIPDSQQLKKYAQFFENLYMSNPKNTKKRKKKQLPTVHQVFEIAHYKSLLAGSKSLLNVEPILCANNIIVGKYGTIFYKITLDSNATFGAYQDGKIRRMTTEEIRFFSRMLFHKYNFQYLESYGANALIKRSLTGGSPKKKFYEQLAQQENRDEPFITQFESALQDVSFEINEKIQEDKPVIENSDYSETSDSLENQIRQALSFWETAPTKPDFRWLEKIEQSAAKLKPSYTDLYEPIRYPLIGQDNCLYYKDGEKTYIISLDFSMPYYRITDETGKKKEMDFRTFYQLLDHLLDSLPQKNAVLEQFEKAYQANRKQSIKGQHTKKTFPTPQQLITYRYLSDLNDDLTALSDIDATLCTDSLICAKKGSIFYKIKLTENPSFTALHNGRIREMNIDEVRALSYELQQKYTQLYLQKNRANALIRRFENKSRISFNLQSIKSHIPIKDLINLNPSESVIETLTKYYKEVIDSESKEVLTHESQNTSNSNVFDQFLDYLILPHSKNTSVLNTSSEKITQEVFLQDRDPRPNSWYHHQIALIKHLIENPQSDVDKDKTYSYVLPPVITNENHLFFKDEKLLYYISLDLKKPLFLVTNLKSKNHRLITPQKLKQIITPFLDGDIEKRNKLLQLFASIYTPSLDNKRDSKHGFPTIAQAIELNENQNILNGGNKTDDIRPTICLNNIIIARYNGTFYKISFGENPSFECFKEERIQQMTREEAKRIHSDLTQFYKNYKLESLGLTATQFMHAYEFSFFSKFKKPIIYTPRIHEIPLSQQILTLTELSAKGLKKASIEETESLFGSLVPLELKENINALFSDSFFEDENYLPDYTTLYKTAFLKYRLEKGKNAEETEFIIPPIYCSDKKLHFKDGPYEYALSLNADNPSFNCKIVKSGASNGFKPQMLEYILEKGFQTDLNHSQEMFSLLKKLYQKWQLSDTKYVPEPIQQPRFDQRRELEILESQLNGRPVLSTVLPCICAGNILYAHYNQIYYKIKLTAPITFEALENNQIRLIQPLEFETILKGIYQNRLQHKIKIRDLKAAYTEYQLYKNTRRNDVKNTVPTEAYLVPNIHQTFLTVLNELRKNTFENSSEKSTLTLFDNSLMAELKSVLTHSSPSSPALSVFYGYDQNLISFEALHQAEVLKRAIQNNNPDLKAEENNFFEIKPVFGNDGRIHYKKGIFHYLISLTPGSMYFSVINVLNKMQRNSNFEEAKQVLIQATNGYPVLREKVITILPEAYSSFFAKKIVKRPRIIVFPRFEQIEEIEKYKRLLNGDSSSDISPVICSGSLLCAKYDNLYYKITLTEQPEFEVLEGNETREMTAEEFNRILQDISHNHIYSYLKKYNITALKDAFYRKREILKTGSVHKSPLKVIDSPKISSLENLALFIGRENTQLNPDLPTFSQLLTGKKETVDIAASHCSDNCIYARHAGVYYKISLGENITFHTYKNGHINPMNRQEMEFVLNELQDTYDEHYLSQLNALNLKKVFNHFIQEQKIIPVVSTLEEASNTAFTPQEKESETKLQQIPEEAINIQSTQESTQSRGNSLMRLQKEEISSSLEIQTHSEEPPVSKVLPTIEKEENISEQKEIPVTPRILTQNSSDLPVISSNKAESKPFSTEKVVQTPLSLKEKRKNNAVDSVDESKNSSPISNILPQKDIKEVAQIQPSQSQPVPPPPQLKKSSVTAPAPVIPVKVSEVQRPGRVAPRPVIPAFRSYFKQQEPVTNQPIPSALEILKQFFVQPADEVDLVIDEKDIPIQETLSHPTDVKPIAFETGFFAKSTSRPDFNYLYATYLMHQRTILAKPYFKNNEDILSCEIPPVLCKNNILYTKENKFLYQISLDKNHPRFTVYDLLLKKEVLMPLKDVKRIIERWLNNNKKSKRIYNELKLLHETYIQKQIKPIRIPSLPSFNEVYYYYAHKTSYREKIDDIYSNPTGNYFSIPPTLCEPNQIISKKGEIYYKIELGEEIRFERLSRDDTYLMTPGEFNSFIREALQSGTFMKRGKEIEMLLRRVYREQQECIFKNMEQDQIKVSELKEYEKRRNLTLRGRNYLLSSFQERRKEKTQE